MTQTDEYWQPIPGFPDYQASTEGRVRNRRGHVLLGTMTRKGCRQVNVRGPRRRVSVEVHRLVAAAFLGPISRGMVITHENGDKLDNRPCNLKATTPADNAHHATSLGLSWPTRMVGESNPNAKLTVEQVRQMRVLRQQGMSLVELGRRFGVTARAAHRVVTRRDWKRVA